MPCSRIFSFAEEYIQAHQGLFLVLFITCVYVCLISVPATAKERNVKALLLPYISAVIEFTLLTFVALFLVGYFIPQYASHVVFGLCAFSILSGNLHWHLRDYKVPPNPSI